MLRVERRRRRRLFLPVLMTFIVAALIAPASASAAVLTTFDFYMGSDCVGGVGPPNSEIRVTLRSSQNRFQGNLKRDTDESGYWFGCLRAPIDAGDKLIATHESGSRTFVVPQVTMKINRTNDVVSGRAPKNTHVELSLRNCQQFDSCDLVTYADVPVNGKGKFSTDFTSLYNIRGHDEVEFYWEGPSGDTINLFRIAPYFEIDLAESSIAGVGYPNSQVTAWLFDHRGRQKSKIRRNTDSFEEGAYFAGRFRKNGRVVDIVPGDFVGTNADGDAPWKVRDMQPQFDVDADTISAKCWPNRPFEIEIDSEFSGISTTGVTNGDGNVFWDLAGDWDLEPGDEVQIECRNPFGDEQDSLYEVPEA